MVKEWFKNFLATTAITIILITLVGIATGDDSVKMISILPSVAANAVIHLGLYAIRQISFRHLLLEVLVEFGFVEGIILATGQISGWFFTTSPWLTVGITAAVFATACLIGIVRLQHDIEEINRDLSVRRSEMEIYEHGGDI